MQDYGDMDMKRKTYAIDIFRDIPVPYAIFKIIYAEDGNVANTKYVYVNEAYCQTAGIRREDLIGRYFLDVYGDGDRRWLDYCQEAVDTGKTVHETIYSPEVNQWMSFAVKPLAQPGYVSFIFMNIDEEHAREMHMQRERVTNEAIVRIAKILNDGEGYEAAMNHALQEISRFIHPDRIYILETDEATVSNTFEWCADGIKSEIDTLQNLPYEEYISGWEVFLRDSPGVIMEDIEVLRRMGDMVDYENLKRQGIKSLMAFPFYRQGHIAGYLGVDNYEVTNQFNTAELLETMSFFLGARIMNHQLIQELEHLGHSDGLTGINNWNAYSDEVLRLRQSHDCVGVIFIDMNGLKVINDTEGHLAGNAALCTIAGFLTGLYGGGCVYRLGGDEFVVLLPHVTESDFSREMKRLREEDSHLGTLSIAAGGHWIADGGDILKAIQAADDAMYRDKAEYYKKKNKQ